MKKLKREKKKARKHCCKRGAAFFERNQSSFIHGETQRAGELGSNKRVASLIASGFEDEPHLGNVDDDRV